jgi:hypothetical protein
MGRNFLIYSSSVILPSGLPKGKPLKRGLSKGLKCSGWFIRPEDIVLSLYSGKAKGKIATGVYRGNIIEYEVLMNDRLLKVQANTRELYKSGEDVFFSLNGRP